MFAIAVLLFVVGLYIVLTRTQALFLLMGMELMMTASVLNFVIASPYDAKHAGLYMALFIMAISVAEAALWLALLYCIQQREGYTALPLWQNLFSSALPNKKNPSHAS